MRLRRTHLTWLLASASAITLAAPAFAADQPAQTPNTVQEVIVTAEKKAEPLKNVPMSVTALGGNTLDKLQATDFSGYAAMVPGLSLESSNPGQTRITLRGQNAGGVGSTVAVYIDESPFGSSTALLNGSILAGDFDTWDVQRIEVLRGPQGTLYGANSEGGLLKVVTAPPVLGVYQGMVEATGETVSNNGHGGNGGNVKLMGNIPLGDTAALRLDAYDGYTPGWIDNVTTGQRGVNWDRKNGLRASLLWNPTPQLSIRLTALDQQDFDNEANGIDVNPVTYKPLYGGDTIARDLPEPFKAKYENYSADINYDFGPVKLTSITSYGILNKNGWTDDTDAPLLPPTPGVGTPPAPTYGQVISGIFGCNCGLPFSNVEDLKKWTEEDRLSGTIGNLDWLVGGYYTHEKGDLNQHLWAANLPGGDRNTSVGELELITLESTYQEYAGFANFTYHFNDKFDVDFGGRYSSNKQTVVESIGGNPIITGGSTSFGTNSSGDDFTYSIAPRWHIDANTMVYARIASGYRPGGPNALPPLAPVSVPRVYGSDSTVNYEAGIRSTLLDGTLSADVALFYVNWKNIQILEVVDNYGVNANAGSAESRGVEWTFNWRPTAGLNLMWTGAYTDAHLTSDTPAADPDFAASGSPLPYAPKWGTAFDAEYDWDWFGDYRGFIGAQAAYTGSRYADFGSVGSSATVQFSGTEQAKLPAYGTLSARFGVQNDRYRLELWAQNLTNTRAFTSYGDVTTAWAQIGVIQPRTLGVTLSAKW
ncbi:MAG TPA: TonB-dependent receptor [Caulobacteraceae bacterium]|jgi:outer membrane receptor protein involved in Fe transport|nr:TonB-dependent receptor [Caulobacteraceae bacterium]